MGPDVLAWLGFLFGGGAALGIIGLFIRIGRAIERFENLQRQVVDNKTASDRRLEDLENDLDAAIEAGKSGVKGLDTSSRADVQRVHERIDSLNASIGNVKSDVRLLGEGLRDRLSGLERAEAQLGSLASKLSSMQTSIDKSEKETDRIEGRVNEQGQRLSNLEGRINSLERRPGAN